MASRRSGCGSPVGAPTPPPYVKLSLQRLQHPAEQRVNLALRKRLSWITERAPPRHPARQRPPSAPNRGRELARGDSGGDDERETARAGGLRRERPIDRSLGRRH